MIVFDCNFNEETFVFSFGPNFFFFCFQSLFLALPCAIFAAAAGRRVGVALSIASSAKRILVADVPAQPAAVPISNNAASPFGLVKCAAKVVARVARVASLDVATAATNVASHFGLANVANVKVANAVTNAASPFGHANGAEANVANVVHAIAWFVDAFESTK